MPDYRSGEERVMDAVWGRLESPENRARRLAGRVSDPFERARIRPAHRTVPAHGANPLPLYPDQPPPFVCAYPGCDVLCESLDDVMSEHPAR